MIEVARPEMGDRVIVHTWRGDIPGTLINTDDLGCTVLADDDGEYLRPNWARVRPEPPKKIVARKVKSRRGR